MSLVSATRSTQLLNCTSAIVIELQEKTIQIIQYSHQSRLQTGELHELLRKPMNIHRVLQTCTMITGGGGIPPLPTHAQTVDTRPYLFFSIGLGTRLGQTVICHMSVISRHQLIIIITNFSTSRAKPSIIPSM